MPSSGPAADGFPWLEATVAELQGLMASGALTAERLVRDYLERIAHVDWSGAQLNSVIETNPDAVEIAKNLDRDRASRGPRGPLHGIPVLIKDTIDTDDRLQTTAGSLALLGSGVARDAFIVRQLRQAGAIILGKTNLSEWYNFRGFNSSEGWSARAGQCLNPYVLDHNPCGSSSGSAAGVAGNMATLAIGTETDGSIVCPASANSVVGFKPTLGLTSRSGVVPVAPSQDVVGPLARTVADAAALLNVLAHSDPRDPLTQSQPAHPDYRSFLDPHGLRGARIGVWRAGVFGYSPDADEVAERALSQLSRLGAVLVDPADIVLPVQAYIDESTIFYVEFKAYLNQYLLTRTKTDIRSLSDLISFNTHHGQQEMPWFGQENFLLAQSQPGLSNPEYLAARTRAKRIVRRVIDSVMTSHDLDAIVSTTLNPPWTNDLVSGNHFATYSASPSCIAGYPSISIPAGYAHGELPVGISLTGRPWSEGTLLKLAYAFEQGAKVRHPPRFVSSLGVKDFIPRQSHRPPESGATVRQQVRTAEPMSTIRAI
ncbi:MAG: amidase [Lapillicoccus sp.]